MNDEERRELTKHVKAEYENSGRWQTRRHASRSQKHLTEASKGRVSTNSRSA